MKILITRSEPDASIDAEYYRAQGHSVTVLPLLQILPLPARPLTLSDSPLSGEGASSLIFISKNAVRYFPPPLRERVRDRGNRIFAVGPATAKLLEEHSLQSILHPSTHEGSEALLRLPELQDVEGQSFVIVRGTEGRELLADVLRTRGASVEHLPVYEARPIELTPVQLIQLRQAYNMIVMTSMGTLKRAIALGISKQAEFLVLSEKMVEVAQHLGWRASQI
jgi:uroporphyrinogen-III synthase